MNDPKKIRKEKLRLRDSLKKEERETKSESVLENLLKLDEIKKGKKIFCYVSFRSEVNTIQFIERLLRESKIVSVPITYVEERKLDAIKITDINEDLVSGYCGILEPNEHLCKTSIIQPEEIDVVILPGSVFDERGGRFGYGGGFYDRFVQKIPSATRIGLCFELQTVPIAPLQEHDEILDYIVTEERIIRSKR